MPLTAILSEKKIEEKYSHIWDIRRIDYAINLMKDELSQGLKIWKLILKDYKHGIKLVGLYNNRFNSTSSCVWLGFFNKYDYIISVYNH